MNSKIAFIDQSNYAPPFDFHHVSELSKCWDIDFYCSKVSLNDSYIQKIRELPGVRVRSFDISKGNFFRRVLSYISLSMSVVLNYRCYKFIYLQWYLSPLEIILAILIRRKLVFGLHNLVPHGHRAPVYWPFIIMAKLSVMVACYSNNVLEGAKRLYRIPANKICLFQHGYIKPFSSEDPEKAVHYACNFVPIDSGMAFIGSVKKYKGLDQILIEENIEFLKKESFFVYGKFVGGQYRLKKILEDYHLRSINSFFDESVFDVVIRARTILVLPYYDISQSGFMYTLAGRGIPFIASNVGDVSDFLHSIDMSQALFDPKKKGDIHRAYNFVRENFDIFKGKLEIAKPKFDWIIPKTTLLSLADKFDNNI